MHHISYRTTCLYIYIYSDDEYPVILFLSCIIWWFKLNVILILKNEKTSSFICRYLNLLKFKRKKEKKQKRVFELKITKILQFILCKKAEYFACGYTLIVFILSWCFVVIRSGNQLLICFTIFLVVINFQILLYYVIFVWELDKYNKTNEKIWTLLENKNNNYYMTCLWWPVHTGSEKFI